MTSRDWLILIASVSLLVQATFCVLGIWGSLRMHRAAKRMAVSNGRTLTEQLYDAAGVTCWHFPEHDREDCDCRSQEDL
jgi:hypothetical protein